MIGSMYQALLVTVLALLAIRSNADAMKDASMIANGWYAERHAEEFPVTSIDWDYYTQLTYVWA